MTILERCGKVVFVVVLCAASAWSQQSGAQTEQPSAAPSQQTMNPDTRPLSGLEMIGLGSLAGERSYFQPGFIVSESGDSNALLQPGTQPGFEAVTALAGNLNLKLLGKRNQLSLAYQGGGVIYDTESNLNTTVQLAGLSYSAQFRKTSFMLTDRFSYLPGSYVGLGGAAYSGVFSLSSLGLPTVNQSFIPTQGALTGGAGYANIAAAQFEYQPGPRSSITAVGGFQYLYSNQQGYVNANAALAQVGYNRRLTAKDTLAVFYSASLYHYIGIRQDNNSQVVALSYGRRVTGRLALQVFGGPQFFVVTVPGQSRSHTSGTVGADLTYHWPKTQAGIYFYRGLTAGSGVLAGAETDSLTGSLSRQLGRAWFGSLTFGYYHNSGLPQPQPGVQNQSFNYFSGSANLSRRLGRYTRLSLFYAYQTQNVSQPSTTGHGSGETVLRNVFGVTLNFTYRPMGI